MNFEVEEDEESGLVTIMATKEGINKITFHWWGVTVWLSKTNVQKILNIGSVGGGAAIGGLGGLGSAVAGAILVEFVTPYLARAVIVKVTYPGRMLGFSLQ